MIARNITEGQARDTGLAAVLILLIVSHFVHTTSLIGPTIAVLVVTMVWPNLFRPLAYVWFTLANILRKIVSSILLTVVYIVIATPIGLIRTLIGADPMSRKRWKDGRSSVFVERDHLFTARDLEQPY